MILTPQDPPFGIHLCGPPSDGYLILPEPIRPVHSEFVRPYRAIPIFDRNTIVQHYLRPEEMMPFFVQAMDDKLETLCRVPTSGGDGATAAVGDFSSNLSRDDAGVAREEGAFPVVAGEEAPQQLYKVLVDMGLLRR